MVALFRLREAKRIHPILDEQYEIEHASLGYSRMQLRQECRKNRYKNAGRIELRVINMPLESVVIEVILERLALPNESVGRDTSLFTSADGGA